jgi:hypothetical protein
VRKDGTRFWASVVIDPIYRRGRRDWSASQDHPRRHRSARAGRGAARKRAAFRMLVNGITTTPSTCSRRRDRSPTGTWARSASRATADDEVVGSHFSRFYTPEDQAAGMPARSLATRPWKGASKPKAGACARTARASGRAW